MFVLIYRTLQLPAPEKRNFTFTALENLTYEVSEIRQHCPGACCQTVKFYNVTKEILY